MKVVVHPHIRSYDAADVFPHRIPEGTTQFDIGANARWNNRPRPSDPQQRLGWDEADRMDREVGLGELKS